MNQRHTLLLSKLATLFAMFAMLTGARGCYTASPSGNYSYTGYSSPPPGGGVIIEEEIIVTDPAYYYGDISVTVYAPQLSGTTPDTQTFAVTVREGGPFGQVVVAGTDFVFDAYGVGAVDITDLPYAYYDIEIVGVDMFGNSASYAAASLTLDEPLVTIALELEAVTYQGDVVLDLYEPDGGLYAEPIDTIDYFLWEVDPLTDELIFVEQMTELPVAFENPTIPALELGNYYIEVYAYDAFGYPIYEFGADFAHDSELTFLPVDFWYAQ